ncbi:MAG: hypothetical protein ACI9U2_004306, partial [Bradymonadia bacterium]
WIGRLAIGVEIAALYAAARGPKNWVWVLTGVWALSWPPISRPIFLGVPQVAILLPGFVAIAAMIVLKEQSRHDRLAD